MKNPDPKTEPEKTDTEPAKKDEPVARKDEQRTFAAPGIERQKK